MVEETTKLVAAVSCEVVWAGIHSQTTYLLVLSAMALPCHHPGRVMVQYLDGRTRLPIDDAVRTKFQPFIPHFSLRR